MFRFVRLSTFLMWCFASAICGIGLVLASFYLYLAPTLPSAEQLKTTQLQTPLRIYSSDNKKIAEFGEKRRTPIDINVVPVTFTNAFIAAEDNRFFEHGGIDLKGLARASFQLISTGRIVTGGSTITMQVAKNFFLSRERTFIRKFNEIFLALQIEQSLSKNEILELYLNKIYLGNRAYGIHAAAEVYYGKMVDQLSLAEMAMIAGLPKAPSRYNPLANATRAVIRRNWILDRMLELDMISAEQHQAATSAPVTARFHGGNNELNAPHIAEMARLEAVKMFGAEAYTEGLKVFVTVKGDRQTAANKAMKDGLESYDRRHGYRGPLNQLTPEQQADQTFVFDILRQTPRAHDNDIAMVTELNDTQLKALLGNGQTIELELEKSDWLAPMIDVNRVGPNPKTWNEVFEPGAIIEVALHDADTSEAFWTVEQTPQVQGALVSLNPNNGAIEALVGGYDFKLSHYNRAIQAKRQPGSNFKPFIYQAALERGNTAATLINDAPIVFDDKNLEAIWRPENSSGKFYGPTRLRKALYNSRNLVSIRLLKKVGIANTLSTLTKFSFDKSELPRDLSLALGSAALTPMKLAQGYAMLANGGHFVEPYLIQRIEDSEGNIIYEPKPYKVCKDCSVAEQQTAISPPEVAIEESTSGLIMEEERSFIPAPRIADERALFVLHSMLKDVILKGTGRRALALKRDDIAGKTGTTNDQKDAWFSGYNTQLHTSVWVGFDTPTTLGRREYGAKAALPIWIDYMKAALAGQEKADMARPPGIVSVRIDPKTGKLATPGQADAMFELFRQEYAPTETAINENALPSANTEEPALTPEDIF